MIGMTHSSNCTRIKLSSPARCAVAALAISFLSGLLSHVLPFLSFFSR